MTTDAHAEMLRNIRAWVTVVDDFVPDIDALRAHALRADYRALGGGVLATGLYSDYFGDTATLHRIAGLVGQPLVPADPAGTGRFSLRTADMTMGLDVHADSCLLGGILYLNRPEQCRGGTSLFRHRATGLYAFPDAATQARLGLAADDAGYFRYFCAQEGRDRSRWEEVARIEMRYNRLVLIAGALFHSHTATFGATIEDGRLVQLYFLDARDDAPDDAGDPPPPA